MDHTLITNESYSDHKRLQWTVNKNDNCKSCVFVEVHESKTFHMSFLADQVRNAIRLFGEFQLNIIKQFRTTVLKIRSRDTRRVDYTLITYGSYSEHIWIIL